MDIGIFERLIPAGEVLDTLASEHDRRGTYATWEVCKEAAHETILARLLDGQLVAWATGCKIDCNNPSPGAPGEIISDYDFYSRQEIGEVPLSFWCHYFNAGKAARTADLVASDFRFSYVDEDFSSRSGGAYGVAFDRRGLPHLNWFAPVIADEAKRLEASASQVEPPIGGPGRKPANWWPAFAAELAIYVHDEGVPDGSDTEGQGTIIDAVLSRLAERGAREPSRASIQPVVNDVLRRLRAARN